METKIEWQNAHTNVIILNGNRLDNNRLKVKQIIVLLPVRHWVNTKMSYTQNAHRQTRERRRGNKHQIKNRKSSLLNSNDDGTCAKTLCKNLFTTKTK